MARQDPPKPVQEPKSVQQEVEFLRKMVLGMLGTLESKGFLSQPEVDSIIRAARQASTPPAAPRRSGPALPGSHWVDGEGQPLGMDRSTPIAIPDVKRQGEGKPSDPAEPKAGEKLPVIDMNME